MTMEQITAKAQQMRLSPALMDLLEAAREAGRKEATRDLLIDMREDGNTDAVQLITANYPL